MKRDIRKAVEEIKSAGMEEFLHQDPSSFEFDEEHSSCDDDCHSSCHECDDHKHSSRKRKKFDYFWYKKRNC